MSSMCHLAKIRTCVNIKDKNLCLYYVMPRMNFMKTRFTSWVAQPYLICEFLKIHVFLSVCSHLMPGITPNKNLRLH